LPRVNYRQTANTSNAPNGPGAWLSDRSQMPYIIPLFAFVAVMLPSAFGTIGGINFTKLWFNGLPVVYTAKTLLAAFLLWFFWKYYTPIRWTHLGIGAVTGLVGTVLWIGTEYGCQWLGFAHPPAASEIYNPDVMLAHQWQRWTYLCIRVAGPTLVVPIMEELFFRDFLMRILVNGAAFEEVPVGTFTWTSLIVTSLVFGINHGMPPSGPFVAGVVYGLLMGLLVIRTKSLGSCIVAHAVTNWTLYLYVIYTGDWQFM
jgi:uncharacterized protein